MISPMIHLYNSLVTIKVPWSYCDELRDYDMTYNADEVAEILQGPFYSFFMETEPAA